MIWYFVGAALWLAFGVVASGWCFAYFQRSYPESAEIDRAADIAFARATILLGLPSFIVCLTRFKYGRMCSFGWMFPR